MGSAERMGVLNAFIRREMERMDTNERRWARFLVECAPAWGFTWEAEEWPARDAAAAEEDG